MTKEEIIDVINREFKGKSVEEGEAQWCMYRSPCGKKCAVGMFIPDNMYDISMEMKNSYCVIDRYKLKSYMPFGSTTMHDFQKVHDRLDTNMSVEEQKQLLINFVNEQF